MAIRYAVVYEFSGKEVIVGMSDHCFGAMKNMPWTFDSIRYDFRSELSSPETAISNLFAISKGNEYIKEVRLLNYNLSSHWSGFDVYLSFMDTLKESEYLPFLTKYTTDHSGEYISVPVSSSDMWEDVMPKLFFIRNLMAYSETLPKFLEGGINPAAAAIATLYFAPARYGSIDKIYPDNDCEYGYFDTSYLGDDDFLQIMTKDFAYSSGFGSDRIVENSGYLREEDYEYEEIVWDENADYDDNGYYFALNKTLLSPGESTFQPFRLNGGEGMISDVIVSFKNYLKLKGY